MRIHLQLRDWMDRIQTHTIQTLSKGVFVTDLDSLYCRLLKGAGSQSVVRCVSTNSGGLASARLFFAAELGKLLSCWYLPWVCGNFTLVHIYILKRVFGHRCAACVLVSTCAFFLWTRWKLKEMGCWLEIVSMVWGLLTSTAYLTRNLSTPR